MTNSKLLSEVRNWIYRNARPVDLARWQYHFEQGKAEDVMAALRVYQNEDGGFGHAIECDCWNPASSPIQTFCAIQILKELDIKEKMNPIVQGILEYLDSGKDFDGKTWAITVPSNNDYPHAPWWHAGSEHHKYNPTAGLAGFALYYSEPGSGLYEKCKDIATQAAVCLLQSEEMDMHVLICYIALFDYCKQAGITELFVVKEFEQKLKELINRSITKDTDVWATSYICKPSQFLNSPESIFYQDNKEIAEFECEFIQKVRNAEGVWEVTWGWAGYPDEWAISKNWWMGTVAVNNMLYLRNFGKLD